MHFEKQLTEMEVEKERDKLVVTSSVPRPSTPPSIESVTLTTPSEYQLGLGGYIDVMVRLNQPVTVTGKPTLTIQFYSGETRSTEYESGSGKTDILFRYRVNKGDHSQGISVPNGQIRVPNGSTIKGTATGHDTNLNHPAATIPDPELQVTDEFDEQKVSEVVNNLSRSQLPTLVVEGHNDRQIYKWIAEILSSTGGLTIDLYPAGGRVNLLEIYDRRSAFASLPVAFVADPDHLVLEDPTKMLKHYEDIIWTTGYSIENDLYTDGNPSSLINSNNITVYNAQLQVAIEVFAGKVVDWLTEFSAVPNRDELRNRYRAVISANASLKLRGKDLFDVLNHFYPDRGREHMRDLRLYKRVIDTVRDHRPLITRLISEIRDEINRQKNALPPAHREALISIRIS